MKESDITPRVIELSKEIAKHWRMEIYEGCWFVSGLEGQPILYKDILYDPNYKKPDIPIPSISDCLEKLKELGYKTFFIYESDALHLWYVSASYSLMVEMEKAPLMSKANSVHAPSLHEALLSALLEVVEKEKNNE